MKLSKKAQIFYKDNNKKMLAKTTDLCFSAHQDDIEIMAYGPISSCYKDPNKWFTGVVITDGANSPRNGIYENFSNEQMKQVRIEEQLNASIIGEYAAQICLGFPSSSLYQEDKSEIINNIIEIILSTQPENIYIHNLADKHKTHVASAITVLEAIKKLPKNKQPKKVYGMEVWRGLDWLSDKDKICFDTSNHPNIANALLGVFDSQISGGKRYDSAAIGRRLANATFFESHSVDSSSSLSYGIDLTPIITENINYLDFINNYIDSFKKEVNDLISSLTSNK